MDLKKVVVKRNGKKRKDLSFKEKIEVLHRYDTLPKMSQRSAAAKLEVSQPVLCKILKTREELLKRAGENENIDCKRIRSGKDKQVEQALKAWFTSGREPDAPVNGVLMRQKAEELAAKMGKTGFVATDGWFNRWRKRENIDYKRKPDEQIYSCRSTAEKSIEDEWLKLISSYAPENVYMADETGLYLRALPEHINLFNHESTNGKYQSILKERVTILCCVSTAGEKKRLLVIGKDNNPRSFEGVKSLPVEYFANESALMTNTIFNEWLWQWDNELKHDILLLMDNCSAHVLNLPLKHINLTFLPADTTALTQPPDQGIIQTLKIHYRREMRARILDDYVEGQQDIDVNDLVKKNNLLEALHLLAMSWNRLPEDMIKKCFTDEIIVEDWETKALLQKIPPDMTKEQYDSWMAIDEKVPVAPSTTDPGVSQTVYDSKQEVEGGNDSDDDGDDRPCCEKPPTHTEMRQALKILKLGVQHMADDFSKQYEYEQYIHELLRKKC